MLSIVSMGFGIEIVLNLEDLIVDRRRFRLTDHSFSIFIVRNSFVLPLDEN